MIDQQNYSQNWTPIESLKENDHFYDEFNSLSDISFDINQGEIVAI